MAKNQENRALYPQGLKRCSKCKEIKPLAKFNKKSSTWDGLRSNCKICDDAYHKQYRSIPENKQKESATCKVWAKNNPERIRFLGRRWSEQNKERRRLNRRAFHLANKESENAKSRKRSLQWAKDNPERHRTNGRNRHARVMGAKGSHTDEQWKCLLTFFKDRCPCCGEKRKLTQDHIIPIAWGGSNFIDNLQPLCKKCNSTKGDRYAIDYRPRATRLWAASEMTKANLSGE